MLLGPARVVRESVAWQQRVRRLPARYRGHARKPCGDRWMTHREIISVFGCRIVQVRHHGDICDGWPLCNCENIALQMLFENEEEIVEPLSEMS